MPAGGGAVANGGGEAALSTQRGPQSLQSKPSEQKPTVEPSQTVEESDMKI